MSECNFFPKPDLALAAILLLFPVLPAHAVQESSGCQDIVIENRSLKICSEFNIGGTDSSSGTAHLPAEIIGVYNGKNVFAGTDGSGRDPDILGYVSDESGGFILKNIITFKCRRSVPECAPGRISTERLSKTVYLVKAGSIPEWQNLYNVLSEASDVAHVSISKDYGVKMDLR